MQVKQSSLSLRSRTIPTHFVHLSVFHSLSIFVSLVHSLSFPCRFFLPNLPLCLFLPVVRMSQIGKWVGVQKGIRNIEKWLNFKAISISLSSRTSFWGIPFSLSLFIPIRSFLVIFSLAHTHSIFPHLLWKPRATVRQSVGRSVGACSCKLFHKATGPTSTPTPTPPPLAKRKPSDRGSWCGWGSTVHTKSRHNLSERARESSMRLSRVKSRWNWCCGEGISRRLERDGETTSSSEGHTAKRKLNSHF